MEQKDINAILKRRRYHLDPELYRQKNIDYKKRTKANLPHCDDCQFCVLVEKEKLNGYRRLCISKMRLIEQKVANSPQWCEKRAPSADYIRRRERILAQKKEKAKNVNKKKGADL